MVRSNPNPASAARPTPASGGRRSDPIATDAPPATRVQDRAPDSAPIEQTAPVEEETPPKLTAADEKSTAPRDVTSIANKVLSGAYGTGRERDIRLKKDGHDVAAVRKEVYRLRGERQTKGS